MAVDEKKARTKLIFADIRLEEAKKIQEEWNTSEAFNLESYRNEQTHIAKAITAKKLQADEKRDLFLLVKTVLTTA